MYLFQPSTIHHPLFTILGRRPKMAEACGNRTHRPLLPQRPTGFEDRGRHQPPFASTSRHLYKADGGTQLYYLMSRWAIFLAIEVNAIADSDSGSRIVIGTPVSPPSRIATVMGIFPRTSVSSLSPVLIVVLPPKI